MSHSAATTAPLAATGSAFTIPPVRRALHAVLATNQRALSPLIARLTLGAVILPHGAQKVLGWFGGQGFTAEYRLFTETLGIPAVLTVLVFGAEFLGAIGLLLGLGGRLAALAVGMTMTVAALLFHRESGFFMNWFGTMSAGKEGFEYHILAIGLAVIVLVRGSGAWSLDQRLARLASRR